MKSARSFGWPEIILCAACKTVMNLNYKFMFTYTPFLVDDFKLTLTQWGLVLTLPELMMVAFSAPTVLLAKLPPNLINFWAMMLIVLPNILQPLGFQLFNIPAFPWILANRLIFGIAFAVLNPTFGGVIGDFTPESIRGKANGLLEFSWTLSDYFMPVIGIALKQLPIGITFYAQGLLALLLGFGIYLRFPTECKSKSGSIQTMQETTPLVTRGDESTSTYQSSHIQLHDEEEPARFTLCDRRVIGIIFWAILAPVYMIMFSFYGVWLQEGYGLNAQQVGYAYFLSFTLAETLSFVYTFLLSDRVGLLRTAYMSFGILLPVGLAFALCNTHLNLVEALLLIALFIWATEIMFVSIIAYTTTSAVTDHPFIMASVMWTAFAVGKAVWVPAAPALWQYLGKNIGYLPSYINQYGALFFIMVVFMLASALTLEMGQLYFCNGKKRKMAAHEAERAAWEHQELLNL